MENSCNNCSSKFEITNEDLQFYKKISVPPPTFCPDCRQIRRLVRRNERNLYSRKCDLCLRQIVSVYPAQVSFPVYCASCFWGEKFDSRTSGMDFDYSKPFFEQFYELEKKVPRIALHTHEQNNVNSEYTNHSDGNKNCYMCMNTGFSEDCYYITNYCLYNKNSMDCLAIQKCQLCYDCIDSKNSYNCIEIINSENCTDSCFLYDCIGCESCFMCSNLRHKKNYIRDKQATKEEVTRLRDELKNSESLKKYKTEFNKFITNAPRKFCQQKNCENVTGDHLENSKNVHNSFYGCNGNKDVKFSYDFGEMKDCYDVYEPWKGELEYETHACNDSYNIKFISIAWYNSEITYCDCVFNSQNLFGCVGMHNQKYCILNKQFTKEEYEKTVPKIIEHMLKTKEYGEFFPTYMTPFPYNESVAQEYYPLTKEQALAKGFKWKEKDIKEYLPATNELLACEKCGKNYKIIPQESDFYKKMNLPIPKKCFNCRHEDRMSFRNPRKLWTRQCANCKTEIKSSYSPERPESVYCEKCYLDLVF